MIKKTPYKHFISANDKAVMEFKFIFNVQRPKKIWSLPWSQ
jgi:hypothetical protein